MMQSVINMLLRFKKPVYALKILSQIGIERKIELEKEWVLLNSNLDVTLSEFMFFVLFSDNVFLAIFDKL